MLTCSNKMVRLEKVPCAVPCAGLRRPCAGFFGWMDHSGAHVARSGATPKTGIRHILIDSKGKGFLYES